VRKFYFQRIEGSIEDRRVDTQLFKGKGGNFYKKFPQCLLGPGGARCLAVEGPPYS
jgi:hypothetical protein